MPGSKRGSRHSGASPHWSTLAIPAPLWATHTLDRIEIAVDAAQQVDQHFAFVLAQAGQQSSLAFEGGDDDLVMGRASLRGQRNRMGAAVVRRGPDRDQAAFLKQRQRAAHGALVESDY